MEPTESTTCAIVGGGPAGMVLGLLLARAGVEVTVFEKHGDFLRDFRGDTVHPVTLTLLEDLGLYPQFAALTHSEVQTAEFQLGGHTVTLADFRRLREPHPVLALVPQWDLLNLLAETAEREPNFSLRMKTEITGLMRAGDRVTGVRFEGPDGPGQLRADLTVGCDGRTSTIRTEAGLVPRDFPVPFDVGWFRLDAADRVKYQLTPRIAAGLALILIPREGYYQAGALLRKGAERELHASSLDDFRARIAALVPEGSVESITSWDDVKTLDVKLNRLSRWHQPGLLCIGDAAHAMSPAGGVGINLAIADAVATARILAEPLRAGILTEQDLAAVQKRRLLPTTVIQGMQRFMHRGIGRVVNGDQPPSLPDGVARVLGGVLSRLRPLSVVPAYLIGVGIRPERAPEFAQRSAQ
jgi:2-polyprenyl-6-methoxyphenol hydroxylase-like FAD-dependent oxidoreductase